MTATVCLRGVLNSLRGLARGQADEAAYQFIQASPRSMQGVAFPQSFLYRVTIQSAENE